MHMRHFVLAVTMATTASVAVADHQELNINKPDGVGQTLANTLSQGSYSHPEDMDIPASAEVQTAQRGSNEKSTLLNNDTIIQKYGASAISSPSLSSSSSNVMQFSNTGYSWLKTHPLPNGRVSSNYGGRTMSGRAENHSGLDLAAPTGTPIYATGPGTVTKAGWGRGYGNYVEVDHGNGYVTRYAHASRMHVSAGDYVQAGEKIASVGCTGRCTGPHLHYEVVKNGKRQNPSTYLALLP